MFKKPKANLPAGLEPLTELLFRVDVRAVRVMAEFKIRLEMDAIVHLLVHIYNYIRYTNNYINWY